MNASESIFLTQAENDKYALLMEIVGLKRDELPVKKRIELSRNNQPLVEDVNLKQVAMLLNRSYGSLYNKYMSIIEDLKEITGPDVDDIKTLFSVPTDAYHYLLVNKSEAFDFIKILLKGETVTFQEFWEAHDTSKATALRHLKGVRDLIRSFDIRMYYDPLRLEGDENKIRLVLTMLFWMATEGHTWPFEDVKRDDALKAFDVAIDRFQLEKPNILTRELGAYSIVVTYFRLLQGHTVSTELDGDFIRYPVPNMVSEYLKQPFEDQALRIKSILAQMTQEEAMAESFNIYDIINFGPIQIQDANPYMESYETRYKRYIPVIYEFVEAFIDQIPFDIKKYLNLDDANYQGFVQTMISMTMTTYMFKQDVTSVLADQMMESVEYLKPNDVLKQNIDDTVDYLLINPKVSFLVKLREELVSGYYNVLRQMIQRFAPMNKVKVVVVTEQSFLGYLDLMTALNSVLYVDVSQSDADLMDADMVVTTSSIDLTGIVNPEAVMFKWHQNADSDHFGRMLGLLRGLWIQKSSIDD